MANIKIQTEVAISLKNWEYQESYLQRRSEQLKQWQRVIDKLKLRAAKALDSRSKNNLRNHIVKIQVQKARTEAKLNQLQETGSENWHAIRADLDKSWLELREAFLKASARAK